MLHVTAWETGQIKRSFKDDELDKAKRLCRSLGHTCEDHPGLTGYPPICYVADDDDCLVYNPKFPKEVSNDQGE